MSADCTLLTQLTVSFKNDKQSEGYNQCCNTRFIQSKRCQHQHDKNCTNFTSQIKISHSNS